MNILKLIRDWLRGGCVWYAVISLLILLAGSAMDSGSSMLDVNAYLLMFPFGLCMSAAGLFLRYELIARWVRWIIHYTATLLSFVLLILLPNEPEGNPFDPAFIMILIVALTAVYWILFLLFGLLRRYVRSVLEADAPKSQQRKK